MACRIPKRLRKEPLIEAVWQLVFEPPENVRAGDILPGLLFAQRRASEPGLRLIRLPAAEIPAPMTALDPGLRTAAKFRLESPDSPFLVQVGDRVVTLNCRRPYAGWAEFKRRALALADQLEASGVIGEPRQHSLRYIDLLTLQPPPSIAALQLPLELGGRRLGASPLQLRLELPDDELIHVLQVLTPAEVQIGAERLAGTLIDLETIAPAKPGGWDSVHDALDRLHDGSKALFFQVVLRPEAVEAMEPEYGDDLA
jgi:uncharacterized protein (TIGR04255 family)